MADASGGFDPSSMTSMLPMMLAMLTSGQNNAPSGISNYVPRFSSPGLGQNSMFGMGNFGALGPAGQSLGAMGMMAGYGFMPDLMQRLRANANVDLMSLRQQQAVNQTMLRYSSMNGQQIADSLGHSEWGGALSTAMPFISMLPGASDAISALTPNNITQTGAMSLAHTAMMMDPMGRFRASNLGALERARKRFTEKNGLRNATAMSGFSQDEFANLSEFADDQGFSVQDVDRVALRESLRKDVVDRRFSGKKYSDLSAAERSVVDVDTNKEVAADLRMRATGNAASVIRSTMNALGVDRNTAMMFAQSTNMTSHSSAETNAIKSAIGDLEGFAKAAKMSGEQMINLARALQAQNGGGLSFNMAVAGMAGVTARFANEVGAREGLHGTSNGQAVAEGIQNVEASVMGGGAMKQLLAMASLNDKAKEKIFGLMKAGDIKGLNAFSLAAQRGTGEYAAEAKRAAHMKFSAAEMADMTDEMTNAVGHDAMAGALAGLAEQDALRKAASDPAMKGFLSETSEHQDLLAKYAAGLASLSDVTAAGISAEAAEGYKDWTHRSGGMTVGRAHMNSSLARQALASTSKARAKQKSQRAMIDANLARHQDGSAAAVAAGQGIIPNLAKGKIHGVSDVLEAAGVAVSQEEIDSFNAFDAEEQDDLAGMLEQRSAAFAALQKGGLSDEDKKKYMDQLNSSVEGIRGYGFDENSQEVRDILKLAPSKGAVRQNGQAAPDGASGNKPATGAPAANGTSAGANKGSEVTVKTDAKLEINLKLNDKVLALTDFTSKAAANSGYREIVINGQSQV